MRVRIKIFMFRTNLILSVGWNVSNTTREKKLTTVCLSAVAPVITILKFFKSNAIIVRKGSAIDIPAEVSGLPLPTLQWMKDDVVIEKPDEEKMTMETEEVITDSCINGVNPTMCCTEWYLKTYKCSIVSCYRVCLRIRFLALLVIKSVF